MKPSSRILTLLALALSLSACGSSTPPTTKPDTSGTIASPSTNPDPSGTTTPQLSADKVSGAVSDKLLWGGSVNLLSAASDPTSVTPLEGPIDSQGNLSLLLNTAPPYTDMGTALPPYGSDCVFTGTAPNTSGSIAAYGAMLAYDKQGNPVGTIQETLSAGASAAGAIVARIYADSDQQLHGVVNCSSSGYRLTYDLNLKAGWNTAEASGNNTVLTLKTLSGSAKSSLVLTRFDAGVGIAFDDYSPITLKPGERVSRKAAIYPIGGYSGTVKLSTNVPGLTVEPNSVTVTSPITAQKVKPTGWAAQPGIRALSSSLHTQDVDTTLTFVAAADAADFNGSAYVQATGADGSDLGQSYVQVNLSRPTFSVGVYLPSEWFTAYAGEQTTVPVYLNSYNGFADPIVVSLENALSGIAAPPTIGQANGGVSLPLTVDANVTAGDYEVVVAGTSGSQVQRWTLKLRVQSKRLAIGTTVLTSLTLAPNGDLWGAQGERLIQVRGEQIIGTIKMPQGVTAQRVKVGPDGSVWMLASSGKLYTVLTGTLQEVKDTGNYYSQPDFAIDKQGRAWIVFFDGFNPLTLHRINASTREDTLIDAVKMTGGTIPVINDRTGDNVFVQSEGGRLTKVDTATGNITQTVNSLTPFIDVNTYQSIQFTTLDRQGGLWAIIGGNQGEAILKKVDPETMIVSRTLIIEGFSLQDTRETRLIVENDQTAWLASDSSVYRFNLTNQSQDQISLGQYPDIVNVMSLAPKTGIAYGFGQRYSSSEQQYLRFQR